MERKFANVEAKVAWEDAQKVERAKQTRSIPLQDPLQGSHELELRKVGPRAFAVLLKFAGLSFYKAENQVSVGVSNYGIELLKTVGIKTED